MSIIKFSPKLLEIIEKIDEENNYLAYELYYMAKYNHYSTDLAEYENPFNISYVDIGKAKSCFRVTAKLQNRDVSYDMSITGFANQFFKKLVSKEDIRDFEFSYNRYIKLGFIEKVKVNKIEVPPFKFQPHDVRATFLSLVTKTYPYGYEEDVMQFIPGLIKDEFGNYYKIIGKSTTMFTCHLDTVGHKQSDITLLSKKEDGDEFIYTNGDTILGADDKAGVTILLYMIANKVPGLYYFFIGEEKGAIGSSALASVYHKMEYLNGITKCISFDRRKTKSVITRQLSRICCSENFANALCKELNKSGLEYAPDPTGVFTDSASFVDDITECTNISVGYYNEHTQREQQNITFLQKLAEAVIQVDWEKLPLSRRIGLNRELILKHKSLISEIKKNKYAVDVKTVGVEDKIFIRIGLEGCDVSDTFKALSSISSLLTKYNVKDSVSISDSYIKIELK